MHAPSRRRGGRSPGARAARTRSAGASPGAPPSGRPPTSRRSDARTSSRRPRAPSRRAAAGRAHARGRARSRGITYPLVRVAVAFDHRGFRLRDAILTLVRGQGHDVVDLGVDVPEPKVDYPDLAQTLGQTLLAGDADRGVLVCGSG